MDFLKNKNLHILYLFVFITLSFANYFYPINKIAVLIYSVLSLVILSFFEKFYSFKFSNHIKCLAIIYIILVLLEFFIGDFISPMASESPQNHVFIFLSSLSILTIYKILKYKKYEWKKALFIYSVFFSPHQNPLFQIKYQHEDHLLSIYIFPRTTWQVLHLFLYLWSCS